MNERVGRVGPSAVGSWVLEIPNRLWNDTGEADAAARSVVDSCAIMGDSEL